MNYQWPGNIREMKNVIERLVIMSGQECIEIGTVEEQILDGYEYTNVFERKMLDEISAVRQGHGELQLGRGTLREQMASYEAAVIRARLAESASLKGAARSLGIDTSTLVRKKQKFGIEKPMA
jgi:DNA-binding NtrC family response regulator